MRTLKIKDNFGENRNSKWTNYFSEKYFLGKFSINKTTFINNPLIFPNENTTKENTQLFSIKGTSSVITIEELLRDEGSVIRIEKRNNDNYFVKTGNYIGVLYHNNIKIEIESRFGKEFLKHMILYANDIFLPENSSTANKTDTKDVSQFKFILAQLFIQSLGKASALFGLPKSFRKVSNHSFTVKGSLDINHFIRHNIPLRKKIKSNAKQQLPVQEIVDVLHKAITIINKSFPNQVNSRIKNIKTELRLQKSNKYVNDFTIRKAKKHSILAHPSFNSYKQVLRYAEMVIKSNSLIDDKTGKEKNNAYLINVAELFEVYLSKVLQKRLPSDYKIKTQESYITYGNSFLKRELRPDIVIENEIEKSIFVFDAKYKRMKFDWYNRNRIDFFQIHTYMAYLHHQNPEKKLIGGLLYPIEENKEEKVEENKEEKANQSWFGNDSKLLISGIDLSDFTEGKDCKNFNFTKIEKDFVDEIKNKLLKQKN